MNVSAHRRALGPVILTIAVASAAHAQQGAPQVPAQTEAAEAGATLGEVLVTARKREENLQKTPVSISAFTGSDLAARQIDNISQLSDSTPNFSFEPTTPISGSTAASSVYIRGVGQFDFTLVSEPGVGVYLDGVYIARSVGAVLDMLDVERVEVLRGPQGTVFGKNTIGGAVNVISRRPSAEPDGYVELRTGTDSRLDARASFSGPLSDAVGIRATVARLNQDGYVSNLGGGSELSDTDAAVGRLVLEFDPEGAFSALFAADGTRRRENGRAQKILAFNPQAPVPSFGPFAAVAAFLGVPGYDSRFLAGGPFATNQGPEDAVKSDLDLWGTALTLEFDLGDVTLKSISGYREFDTQFGRDSDNSPFDIVNTIDLMDHQQFSEELQVLGQTSDERFSWLAGLFYLREEGSNRNDVLIPVLTIKSGGAIDNDGWAAFGQGTMRISDPLSLSLGARYTDETKRFTPDQQVIYNEFTVPVFGGLPFADGERILPMREFERSDTDTSLSAALSYQWTDDLMTYLSYAEGFKGGGFDQRVFPPRGPDGRPASFAPERLTQYEAGWKWENGNRTVRLNGAVFFSDYEDVQVRVVDAVAPGVGNAGEGEVRGAELELVARPGQALTLEAGVGYLDTEITALGSDIDPAADRVQIGNRFINSPEWSFDASAAYTAALGNSGDLTLRVDWSWRDKVFNNWANDESIAQDALSLINASLTWGSPSGGWEFVLAGRNLTDEIYIVTGNDEIDTFGYSEAIYARPREWTVSIRKLF